MKFVLFPAEELDPGKMRSVEIDNVRIVVIRTPDGRFHALRDSCAHVGARLSHGLLQPLVEGDTVGSYRLADEKFVVRCQWHGFEFDVETGRCPADPEHSRVRSYRTTLEDGKVVVER